MSQNGITKNWNPLHLHEIFEKVQKDRYLAGRQKILKANESFALRTILQGNFHPQVLFDIPEGKPPFTPDPSPAGYSQQSLDNVAKQLPLLMRGNEVQPVKKERIFISILESIHEKDAEIIIAMKDKNLTSLYSKINQELMELVYPELLK